MPEPITVSAFHTSADFHAYAALHPRSPQWPALERRFKAANPACAACGRTDHIDIHHCEDFSHHPEKELLWDNLISLCRPPGEPSHHFLIGHALPGAVMVHGNWSQSNPNVRADAAAELRRHHHARALADADLRFRAVTGPRPSLYRRVLGAVQGWWRGVVDSGQ